MAAPTITPLRYPGGKQRLTPFIVEILEANNLIGGHYVEPYAGGAGAAMELLFNKKVSSIHLNDSSRAIYAFWYSVLNYTEELCRRIMSASLTIGEWKLQRDILNNPNRFNLLDLGFSTLYLNRCNRSGILSAGVIGGMDQTGNYKMDARFNRTSIIERIQKIAAKKKQIRITNFDAEEFLLAKDNVLPKETLIYLDPPYYVKGSELYLNFYRHDDHKRLSKIIQRKLSTNWVLSYDAATQILDFYQDRNKFLYDLQYNASRVYKGREVFIFGDMLDIPEHSRLEYINVGLEEVF